MKAKNLLFLLMVVCAFPLFSEIQPTPYRSYFGKEYTRWYTYMSFIDVELSERNYVMERDTVLSNGIAYKQIWHGDDHPIYNSFTLGLREEVESGSLYANAKGDTETLISRMDLKVGDKYYFSFNVEKFNEEKCNDYAFKGVRTDEQGDYATADSVYYKDGRKHIRFDVVYKALPYRVPLTFIEGIGPNVSFAPMIGEIVFEVCFNCYENEDGLWKATKEVSGVDFSDDEECLFNYSAIEEVTDGVKIKLIRREGEIELASDQIEGIGVGRVYLYTINGEIIFSKPVQENASIIIPTSGLASGSYVVRFVEEKTKKGWSRTVVL